MSITITPSGAACGAEISDVDLTKPLSPADVKAINDAWLEHLVIYFRDQTLEEEDHLRFTEYFGQAGDYMRPGALRTDSMKDRHKAIMFVSNIRENGEPIGALPDGEMMFHTDTAYDNNLHKATTLFAMEVPDRGGETIFSNQYAVYDALPARLRDLLDGRDAYSAYEFGTMIKTKDRYDSDEMRAARHPIFRTHEETGQKSVFVNELMTEEIDGLDREEGRAVMDEIFAMQREPRFHYAHSWLPGDLIMWDNRCTLHARRDFPSDQRRLLRRITIADNKPAEAS